MTDSLARLRAAWVSVWLDDLHRERLTSGSLAALVRDKHVSGVTTNPTIFARSIADSDAYSDQIRDLQVREADPGQALRELTTFDVRWACDVLRQCTTRPAARTAGCRSRSTRGSPAAPARSCWNNPRDATPRPPWPISCLLLRHQMQ
jgi:Transaldolase/Fructose-6-phosphate aldolase